MEVVEKVQIENVMISANTNTVSKAIAYNKTHKIIAYISANAILILDPFYKDGVIPKVLFTLKGHSERINQISWLSSRALVSVSSDKSFIVWSFEENSDPRIPQNWTFKKEFKEAHSETINYLETYSLSDNEFYILTMCSKGDLKLWQGTDIKQITHRATLLFGKNLQEAMRMQKLGEKSLILLVGGYDSKIHVYTFPRLQNQKEEDTKVFKYKFSLLGHLNSLRDFDFSPTLQNNVQFMASASQDGIIRLWKIQPLINISQSLGSNHEDLKQFESKTSYVLQDENENQVYNIKLESVLSSHQDAVTSVQWGIRSESRGKDLKELDLIDFCLLSASFDFTICVWKPDQQTQIWNPDSTLGAMVGNKHSFFGALFLDDDQQIIAYTYNGAMNQWTKKETEDSSHWVSQLTVKGHFGEVCDLDWDQYQSVLATTSQDQTTRIFSPFKENGWFEIGRPQVHGYDMNTLSFLKVQSDINLPSKIISGGDEKVIRIFEPPYSFVKNFNSLHPEASQLNLRINETMSNQEYEKLILSETKKQPLGLMNKPVMLANEKMRVDEEEGGMNVGEFDPTKFLSNTKDKLQESLNDEVQQPPVEDILMVRTLWPEQQKLYGHAFEVFCIATTPQGDCAASSCKAKDKKYSDIVIWDLRKIQVTVPTCRLSAHTLTVVQMEFSKCGLYLFSCSRDRSFALFKRDSLDSFDFKLVNKQKDAHSRIIWGISLSHDDKLFATASREKSKSVKIWQGIQSTEGEKQIGTLISEINDENPSTTAIRFFPDFLHQKFYSFIVGLESGDINIFVQQDGFKWVKVSQFPQYYSLCSSVRRIKFNTRLSDSKKDEYLVAVGGNDHTVRILKLKINN